MSELGLMDNTGLMLAARTPIIFACWQGAVQYPSLFPDGLELGIFLARKSATSAVGPMIRVVPVSMTSFLVGVTARPLTASWPAIVQYP